MGGVVGTHLTDEGCVQHAMTVGETHKGDGQVEGFMSAEFWHLLCAIADDLTFHGFDEKQDGNVRTGAQAFVQHQRGGDVGVLHGFSVGQRKRVGLDEHRTPLSLNHVNHGEEKQENHQEAVSLRQPNATSHTMAWMKWFFTFTP